MGLALQTYTLESLHEADWYRIKIAAPGSITPKREQARKWCRKNCAWDSWVEFNWDFWFEHERDAVMFQLSFA